jgi:hypothetical protein
MGKSTKLKNNNDIYLEWDLQDQYYVKTDSKLKNKYFFINNNKFLIDFRINIVDRQCNDNKISKRFMTLDSMGLSDNYLICYFSYRIDDKYLKQKEYNNSNLKWIMEYIQENIPNLFSKTNETIIRKELTSFGHIKQEPHFIHKDLGGYLNKELDCYIKDMLFEDIKSLS